MLRTARILIVLTLVVPALAVIAPHVARAAVVEIPLPSKLGQYPPPFLGILAMPDTTVIIPGHPVTIHSISLRVHGTTEVGVYDCGVYRGPTPWQTGIGAIFGSGTFGIADGTV